MQYQEVAGGICAPKGFAAAGVHCGIRANHAEKYDLALIKADVRCAAAARGNVADHTFKTNVEKVFVCGDMRRWRYRWQRWPWATLPLCCTTGHCITCS